VVVGDAEALTFDGAAGAGGGAGGNTNGNGNGNGNGSNGHSDGSPGRSRLPRAPDPV
jgi:hypothetical protein